MRRTLLIAIRFTIATTLVFGLAYPFLVTGIAQLLFKNKANGQLIQRDGKIIGSSILGQPFSSPKYFHSRPSAAGNGYDAANSGGSNYGPTNRKLIERIQTDAATARIDRPGSEVPIDLVTTSASGLDPHITPATAEYQVSRIARERHLSEGAVRGLVAKHTEARQFGFLGESRVNVLELNLDLDSVATSREEKR